MMDRQAQLASASRLTLCMQPNVKMAPETNSGECLAGTNNLNISKQCQAFTKHLAHHVTQTLCSGPSQHQQLRHCSNRAIAVTAV
jgi:hypothetical protein